MITKIDNYGASHIKKYEGFSLKWYALKDGMLTVGYGYAIPLATAKAKGYKVGDTITQAQADAFFRDTIARFEVGTVNLCKKYGFTTLNQNQFNALVSYAYNRGLGNNAGTNGLHQLLKNSKTVQDISKNFMIYWGTNTNYKQGLLNRRKAEQKLFNEIPKNQSNSTQNQAKTDLVYKCLSDLNLRDIPSLKGKVLKVLPKNSAWKSSGKTQKAEGINWIQLGNGWASANYLKKQ